MMKKSWLSIPVLVLILLASVVARVQAVPPLPSSFYGEIHITDNPPIAGDTIYAYVPGVTPAVGSSLITNQSGNLAYAMNVIGDDPDIGGKDGGVESDVVTFKIGTRIVATGVWHSGTNVSLNIHPPQALPISASGNVGVAVSINAGAVSLDLGYDIDKYQWDWDNNGTYDSTGSTGSHTWDHVETGSYNVGLKVTDLQGGEGAVTVVVTIGKGTATVTLGSLTPTYTGSPLAATATTTPPGLTVDFTYDGSATAPTDAKSYALVGTINDLDYQGSASDTFTIGKASTTTVVTGGTFTYDTAAHPATVSVTGANLSLTPAPAYSGSCSTAPITVAEGTTCTASYTYSGDANHTGSTHSAPITINKASASVTITNTSQVYDGNPKSVTVTTVPASLAVSVTYEGSTTPPSAKGDYAVVATVTDPNYSGSNTGTLHIAAGGATVTITGLNPTYDGTAKPVTVTTDPVGLSNTVTYNGGSTVPINAGSYTVVATVTDPNYSGSDTQILVIAKAASTTTVSGGGSITYDGNSHGATVSVTGAGGLSLSPAPTYSCGAPPIDVTITPCAASYNYAGDSNHLTSSGSADISITKRPASVTPNASSKTYGQTDPAFSGTLIGFLPAEGISAVYSRTGGNTVSGSPYTISATLSPSGKLGNYDITYNTANFTINPKAASVAPNPASKVYGDPEPTLTGTLSGFLVADNVTAVYARTTGETVPGSPYTISATLSPAGVLGNYSITYNTAAFTITKATATVTLGSLSHVHDGTPKSASATTTPLGLTVTFTYNGDSTAPTAVGSYAVVGTISDVNYQGSSSGTMNIYATHSIPLVQGWNLVSFRLHPVSTLTAVVLSSLGTNYTLVYAWDSTGGHSDAGNWMKLDRTGPEYGNTLTNINEAMGFWIHMTASDTLDVIGSVPTVTNIALNTGAAGWNLTGYPSSGSLALPAAITSHDGTFNLAYSYHAETPADPWRLHDTGGPVWANDLTELGPGWGFWIKITTGSTWHVE